MSPSQMACARDLPSRENLEPHVPRRSVAIITIGNTEEILKELLSCNMFKHSCISQSGKSWHVSGHEQAGDRKRLSDNFWGVHAPKWIRTT